MFDKETLLSAIDALSDVLEGKRREVTQYSDNEAQDSEFNEGLDNGIEALHFLRKLVNI